MDKASVQKDLLVAFHYDCFPVFPLTGTRRNYRNKFIGMINRGEIRLETVIRCLCGSEELLKVAEKDRFGLPFNTLICAWCGLLITSPRIREADLAKYYELIYHPLIVGTEKGVITDTYSFSPDQGRKIFEFTVPFLVARASPLKVLEIGCADGYGLSSFVEAAKESGIECRAFGTELEIRLKAAARRRGVEVLDEDVRDLKQSGQRFDLIIMSHVVEHMTDPRDVLENISHLLGEAGVLYVEVPGIMNLDMMARWYNSDFLDYLVHAHLYDFNLSSLRNILALSGFKLLSGDEVVRAVCVVGEQPEWRTPENNCEAILSFLHASYISKSPPARSLLRRMYWGARRMLGRMYYPLFQEKPDFSRFS